MVHGAGVLVAFVMWVLGMKGILSAGYFFTLGGDVALERRQRCVGLVLVASGWI